MSHRRRGRKQGDQNGGGKGSGIRGGILERPEGVEIIGIKRKRGEKGDIIAPSTYATPMPHLSHKKIPTNPLHIPHCHNVWCPNKSPTTCDNIALFPLSLLIPTISAPSGRSDTPAPTPLPSPLPFRSPHPLPHSLCLVSRVMDSFPVMAARIICLRLLVPFPHAAGLIPMV